MLSSGRKAFTFGGFVPFCSFDTVFFLSNEIYGHIIQDLTGTTSLQDFPGRNLHLPRESFLLLANVELGSPHFSSACCKRWECRLHKSWPRSDMQLQLDLLGTVPGKVSWERSWQNSLDVCFQ